VSVAYPEKKQQENDTANR